MLSALGLQISLVIYINVGYGVRCGYRLVRNITHGGLGLSVAPYGNAGIKLVLKKKIRNPLEIICHTCVLMKFWLGLYAANTMLRVAKEVLASHTRRQVNQILLPDDETPDQADDAT